MRCSIPRTNRSTDERNVEENAKKGFSLELVSMATWAPRHGVLRRNYSPRLSAHHSPGFASSETAPSRIMCYRGPFRRCIWGIVRIHLTPGSPPSRHAETDAAHMSTDDDSRVAEIKKALVSGWAALYAEASTTSKNGYKGQDARDRSTALAVSR